MKKILFLIPVIAMFAMSCNNSGDSKSSDNKDSVKAEPRFASATEYNAFIIGEQTKIINTILDLSASFEKDEEKVIRDKYAAFGKQTNLSLEEVKKLEAYNGNTEFREAAIKLFGFYKEIYDKDYKTLIDIVCLKDKATKKDLKKLDKIVEDVTLKEKEFDSLFASAQNKFAAQNNMKIKKNEIQDKIDNMGN
ncbi:MAG: hypothetical protein V2A54_03375 [Bacteroidota bacterium]